MKKTFLISLLALITLFAGAQWYAPTKMANKTTASNPASFDCPDYVYFWGTTNDTLIASDTITQVIRVRGDGLIQLKPQITVTKVSGTVTNNIFISASMDGTNWTAIDTVAYSNTATATAVLTDPDYTNFNWAFLRFQGIAGATTQKAWYKVILLGRY